MSQFPNTFQPPYGGPSSSYGGPPTGGPPPSNPNPAFGYPAPTGGYNPSAGSGFAPPAATPAGYSSAPPQSTSGKFAPPPSGFGAPSSSNPAPRPNVMFFSPATGAAVSAVPTGPGAPGIQSSTPPPPSGMPPPPTAGPPTSSMPPPPTGMGGPAGFYGAGPSVGAPPTGTASVPPPPTGVPGVNLAYGAPQSMAAYGAVPGYGPPGYGAAPAAPGAPYDNISSAFGSSGNLSGMNTVQQGTDGPLPPAGAGAGAPLPTLDEIDFSIQCNPNFMRATVSKIVSNQAMATASRLPLGLVCKPMWGDKGTTNDDIEVVDFGSTGIVRCKRCRTYINPFVTWTDNGRRWRCNICGMLNDVPSTYFSHLDAQGKRRDKDQRPELSRCSVEFVAPGDYMVRPPQPPVYYFVIDVSEGSIASGMIQSCVNAIKASLDEIPGTPRTQVGFITFDTQIHFYNLKSTLKAPQMLIVPDVHDVILPLPEDLLVNLQDSRTIIDTLLDSLPSMFKHSTAVNTCTGPALMAAKRVIQHLGGKIMLFQSSLPSVGEGALKIRENVRLLGTDKEHTLLNAEEQWYKNNAIEFSRLQIAIDTFLFSGQYTDLATISVLSKYTAGSTYYYPGFHAPRDGIKFEKDLCHVLTRSTAFEAVMRVRATRGLRFSNFYGNYFVRGTDLLALPNCTSDSTFALDIAYDETQLQAQVITIQAALLYTSSTGERRIRVHTMVLPVTQNPMEMVESLDMDAAMNILSKQAVDVACKTGMENARTRVHQTTVEILRAAKSGPAAPPGHYGGMPGYQQQPQSQSVNTIPNSLVLLPLYSMSLQKSLVLRGGADVRIDERAYFQHLLSNMDVNESKVFIYPRMFSIHDMSTDTGLPCDNVEQEECAVAGPFQVRLPSILNLSYERLTSDGIFLLENGYDMFMWIGRSVNPAITNTLFGFPSLDNIDPSTLQIVPENSDFSQRVHAVIVALRDDRTRYMQLHFIREGDGHAEAYFARYLIEDRANFPGGNMSYNEYHGHISRAMSGLPG